MPLEMVRRRPIFALELLALGLRATADGYHDARLESVELNERLPAEYLADSVISLQGPDGDRRFLIVEVQRAWDSRKVWSWAAYVGGLMGRHRCAVILIVICLSRTIAARYNQPIQPPDSCMLLCPIVIGPDQLPLPRDTADVLASPEVAVLAALTHPDDLDTVTTVGTALADVPDDRGSVYYDYLHGQLPEPVRAHLEEIMTTMTPETESPFERLLRKREALAEARAEARFEARAKAELAGMVLAVLEARGLKPGPDQRERITACTDSALLTTWATRAATVTDVTEVFQDH
ncbi:hypothetical protein [Planomonospora venezuelensis]|uniref:Uncharacterized protein n=1 Tax=Planomonospora venezuelensis TaxID=1999 RepID=A0A841DKC0_PLAVE|nr:hypothetical protein [Planomonospora venezuelensis]MBB5967566.1 hypothetical protein [Planomonospora venezuelensis]